MCMCVFVHVSEVNIPIHSCLQTCIFLGCVHIYVIAASHHLGGQNGMLLLSSAKKGEICSKTSESTSPHHSNSCYADILRGKIVSISILSHRTLHSSNASTSGIFFLAGIFKSPSIGSPLLLKLNSL